MMQPGKTPLSNIFFVKSFYDQITVRMKKFFFGIIAGIGLTSMIAFKVANYEVKNNTAEVSQFQGFYIFTDCRPVKEYEYIGTVKSNEVQYTGGLSFGDLTYDQLANNLITITKRKIRKGKMGEGNAFIIHPESESADFIKIKE